MIQPVTAPAAAVPQELGAERPSRAALAAVAVLSAAVLAFEVLLVRLLSIAHWHHFTGLVVSLALLGMSAAGTVLALGVQQRVASAARWLGLGAVGFAAGAPLAVGLAQRVPFNALALGFEPWQAGWLALIYAVLALPFFCAGLGIGAALGAWRRSASRVYAADLLGAGAGSAGAIASLLVVAPEGALDASAALAGLAAALAFNAGARPRAAVLCAALAAALAGGAAGGWTGLQISEFKALPKALSASGARVVAHASGPWSRLDAVVNERAPYRAAPGLSLVSPASPSAQLAVFRDADEILAVDRVERGEGGEGRDAAPAYLAHTTSAAAYQLLDAPAVAVLGLAGGAPVLQALGHGARRVLAVEGDRDLVALLAGPLAGHTRRWMHSPRVSVLRGDARRALALRPGAFDLVVVGTPDRPGSVGQSLAPSRLLTTGGLATMLAALGPGGLLSIEIWNHLPPRTGPRVLATAAAALRVRGVERPGEHLAWVRGWRTATVLVGRSPIDARRIAALRAFAAGHRFDLAWLPGLEPAETNRFNALPSPTPYELAAALLGPEPEVLLERYKLDIEPASDARPYPFAHTRWRHLPELLALRSMGGAGQLDGGLLVLVASLAVAAIAGVALALAPMLALGSGQRAPRVLVLGYFAAVGLGFITVEMAIVHSVAALLGLPAVALALVLGALLVLAGAGSAAHARWGRAGAPVAWTIAGVALACAVAAALLPAALATLDGAGGTWISTAALLAGLVAVALGVPFPAGIAAIARTGAAADVAWAWAVNGATSVVGAVAGTLIALQWGYPALLALAACAYAGALACYLAGGRAPRSSPAT